MLILPLKPILGDHCSEYWKDGGTYPSHCLLSVYLNCFAGDELECMHPYVYRNIAKQLNISVAVEAVVSHAFLSVATEILVMGK